jgi:predicted ferric reductase
MLMIEAFRLSGMMAGILMTVAGFTGFFAPSLRKRIKGPFVFTVHRWCGLGAVACGLTHGLIYMLYLG